MKRAPAVPFRIRCLALVAIACLAAGARAQDGPAAPGGAAPQGDSMAAATGPAPGADLPGRPIFLQACAACHGANGDGHGTTALDRPARSFAEGGFSFGNTPEAIVRTLTHGIPGSPMPAFGESFNAQQLQDVALYVIALGPPQTEVTDAETRMLVTDRPRIARGILAPITEGAPIVPRGLLVGLTDGLTFEYRIDDVRLLGVRAGEFAQRSDWTGRGGTPLVPLGKLIQPCDGGQPGELFVNARAGQERELMLGLRARLLATDAGASVATLSYALAPGELTAPLATVVETPSGLVTPIGSGFRRHLLVRLEPGTAADALGLRVSASTLAESAPARFPAANGHGPTTWWWHAREDGVVVCTGVRRAALDGGATPPALATLGADALVVALPADDGRRELAVELLTVLASPANDQPVPSLLANLADT